ncbi:MAG: hypothetical protein KZQ62_09130 [Candidatus Thiodiazotropha sp. (ex Lucinoma aequizonata)]|nr:hypothetical protein [Candidatus Thiodiazotropha sp. (ex Lucinoma aequizonata)]
MLFNVASHDVQLPQQLLTEFGSHFSGKYLTLIAEDVNWRDVRDENTRKPLEPGPVLGTSFRPPTYWPNIPVNTSEGNTYEYGKFVNPGTELIACGTIQLADPAFQAPVAAKMNGSEIDKILIYDWADPREKCHLELRLAALHTEYNPDESRWAASYPQGEILCWMTIGRSKQDDLRVNNPRVYAGDYFKIYEMYVQIIINY